MKKYDNYKDSGLEWIGKIPEHWDVKKLKFISKICNGQDQKAVIDDNGIYPIYGSGGIFGKAKSFLFDQPSVLLGRKGTIDKPQYVVEPFWTVDTSYYTKIKDGFSTRLFYYLCTTINFELYKYGSAIPSMTQGHLNEIKFSIPNTLDEQTAIANYLDHKTTQIDTLIAKKEQFISLLQEERTAVINQAVTKGLDPKVKMKDSGIEWLGEIPEHWEVKKLKYLCNIINEKTSEKPNYVLALENIKSWTGEIIGNPLENKMEGDVTLFKKDDILFNKLRPYLAKVIKTQCDGGCVGELLVLRPNQFLTPTFLYYRMISEAIITIVDNSTYGTKMPRASWEKFISLIGVGFPSIDEQNKITDYIENKISDITLLLFKSQQEIELLKEYKTALISEVVTGKVDVRDVILN